MDIGVMPYNLEPYQKRNQKCQNKAAYSHIGVAACHQHCKYAQHRRYTIQHRHCLLLTQPQGQEPVMQVLFVGMKGTLLVDNTSYKSKGRVKYGNAQSQQRY